MGKALQALTLSLLLVAVVSPFDIPYLFGNKQLSWTLEGHNSASLVSAPEVETQGGGERQGG